MFFLFEFAEVPEHFLYGSSAMAQAIFQVSGHFSKSPGMIIRPEYRIISETISA